MVWASNRKILSLRSFPSRSQPQARTFRPFVLHDYTQILEAVHPLIPTLYRKFHVTQVWGSLTKVNGTIYQTHIPLVLKICSFLHSSSWTPHNRPCTSPLQKFNNPRPSRQQLLIIYPHLVLALYLKFPNYTPHPLATLRIFTPQAPASFLSLLMKSLAAHSSLRHP